MIFLLTATYFNTISVDTGLIFVLIGSKYITKFSDKKAYCLDVYLYVLYQGHVFSHEELTLVLLPLVLSEWTHCFCYYCRMHHRCQESYCRRTRS